MATLQRTCPAKLNLTLNILGIRPDGFHEVESFVALVDFCDELEITPQEDGRYALTCDDPSLPDDGSNLVLKAARVLARTAATNHGADFVLRKRIPAGAGLGGGSSNAAATLAMLNDAWHVGFDRGKLAELGALIGSDVPLFLHDPIMRLTGRGERVETVRVTAGELWAVLVLPGLHCATPRVYAAWDASPVTSAVVDASTLRAALQSAEGLRRVLVNDLREPAMRAYPELRAVSDRVNGLLGRAPAMSGSGSTLFDVFDDEAEARAAAEKIERGVGLRCVAARLRTS